MPSGGDEPAHLAFAPAVLSNPASRTTPAVRWQDGARGGGGAVSEPTTLGTISWAGERPGLRDRLAQQISRGHRPPRLGLARSGGLGRVEPLPRVRTAGGWDLASSGDRVRRDWLARYRPDCRAGELHDSRGGTRSGPRHGRWI